MRILLRHVCALCALAVILGLVLAVCTNHQSAYAQSSGPDTLIYLPIMAQASAADEVLVLVNQQRALHGCTLDLRSSPQLSAAAYEHSRDMALNDYFSHTGSDQSTMEARVQAVSYQFSVLAENIAVGYSTPHEVVDAWMDSPTHRANILNCNLQEIGVGYYYQSDDQPNVRTSNPNDTGPYFYYWTQDFGTPLR